MRNLYMLICLFGSVLYTTAQSSNEVYVLEIPVQRYMIDTTNNLILCKIDVAAIPALGDYGQIQLLLNETYQFIQNPDVITHQASYTVEHTSSGEAYTLYFTIFPLVSVSAAQEIENNTKGPATFVYVDTDEIQMGVTGIELRGGYSQTFPKKTYDLEFWEDETGEATVDFQFGTLRSDDDWILDAIYNEPLRLRALNAHQVWLDMHTLYYQELEEEAKSGADVMFVDMFLNGVYNGIYLLSEQVDRKQLKLKKYNGEIRGELYKADSWSTGNVIFEGLPDFNNTNPRWGGYELKYPSESEVISWENLYDFTDFVINSATSDFHAEIGDYLDVANAIDYFIFLNVTRARDNRGKNLYTGRYNQDNPYFFVPWDLDGVFGTNWQGVNEDETNDIISNVLFDRLIRITPSDEIKDVVYERWNELRADVLSDESLNNRLTGSYDLLNDTKVYERESLIYPNYPFTPDTKAYMDNWLSERLANLDIYFGNFLSVNEVSKPSFKVYPNPAQDIVSVENSSAIAISYTLHSINGQAIKTGVIDSINNTIAIGELAKGVYILNISGSVVQKIIKL